MTATIPSIDLPDEKPVHLPTKTLRHKWDYQHERRPRACDTPTGNDQNEKPCFICGLWRITVHPPKPNIPFRMWRWGEGKQFKAARTPECKPRAAS